MQGASFSSFDTTGAAGDFQENQGQGWLTSPRMQISVASNNGQTADRDHHALQTDIIQLYYRW